MGAKQNDAGIGVSLEDITYLIRHHFYLIYDNNVFCFIMLFRYHEMKSRKASFLISSRFSQCQSQINFFLQAVMGFQNLLPPECVVVMGMRARERKHLDKATS